MLWIKWVHGVYMKNNDNIRIHTPPLDSSWYWKRVNALKAEMHIWYLFGACLLTPEGKYSLIQSYNTLLGQHARLRVSDLLWIRFAQPKHRFIL